MSPEEASLGYSLTKLWAFFLEETGYAHIHATKPDTVGTALSNSPIGLPAYLLEKFSTWTNKDWRSKPNGGMEPHYKLDDLLNNVMIYWATNSITTSQRLYAEGFLSTLLNYGRVPVLIPTACLEPPKEPFGAISSWTLRDKYQDLRSYKIASKGGHFSAFEVPGVQADDVLSFFSSLEKDDVLKKSKVEL